MFGGHTTQGTVRKGCRKVENHCCRATRTCECLESFRFEGSIQRTVHYEQRKPKSQRHQIIRGLGGHPKNKTHPEESEWLRRDFRIRKVLLVASLNQGMRIDKTEDHSEEGLRPILFLPLVKGNASEHRTLTSNPSNPSPWCAPTVRQTWTSLVIQLSQEDDQQELRHGPIPAQ